MRYFAMIEGERRGPYELAELADAGVRPDTYLWCKGMDDWQMAEDVADICRFYRQRIFDLTHPTRSEIARPANPAPPRVVTDTSTPILEEEPVPSTFPPVVIFSLILILFGFFPTAIVALVYSFKAKAIYTKYQMSLNENSRSLYSEEERSSLRAHAIETLRRARLWVWVTFFLSIILYAVIGKTLF